MAKILRSETSLLKRQLAIGRELSRGGAMRIVAWGAALAAAALLGAHAVLTHTYPGAISARSRGSSPSATKSTCAKSPSKPATSKAAAAASRRWPNASPSSSPTTT